MKPGWPGLCPSVDIPGMQASVRELPLAGQRLQIQAQDAKYMSSLAQIKWFSKTQKLE